MLFAPYSHFDHAGARPASSFAEQLQLDNQFGAAGTLFIFTAEFFQLRINFPEAQLSLGILLICEKLTADDKQTRRETQMFVCMVMSDVIKMSN